MKLNYSLSARVILDPKKQDHILDIFSKSEITHLDLHGYFWGHFDSSLEEMIQAREILSNQNIEVGIISVAVGHPGNSMDPDNPTLDLNIPSHWRYRIDKHGQPVYHCADIEEHMIQDNIDAVQQFKKAGFKRIFFDDDFRMGNWGNEIQGCFCDACVEKFNQTYNQNESRESLRNKIEKLSELPLLKDWVEFTCEKVNKLISAISLDEIDIGLMIMHRGDERHGIDIPAINQINPVIHYRVGEAHFNDREFNPPAGKASEILGIQQHMNLMQNHQIYSETTIFPSRALSPANWVYKAKLAAVLGIPNIYLMNGLPIIENSYWEHLQAHIPEIKQLADISEQTEHNYPVNVMCGTHGALGENIQIPTIPLLAGLPVKPLRADYSKDSGEILLVYGKYKLGIEWEQKIHDFKYIYFDQIAAKINQNLFHQSLRAQIIKIPGLFFHQFLPISTKNSLQIHNLQNIISKVHPSFPYLVNCANIWLIWLKEKATVVLVNLDNKINLGKLVYQDEFKNITLKPLEFRIEPL
jgi:hypothetical protein